MAARYVDVEIRQQRNLRWRWRRVRGAAPRGTSEAGSNYARRDSARRGARRALRPKVVRFV